MVRIITDSTCDMDHSRAAQLGITIVPLHVFFGEEEYIDGITLTRSEFYNKLRQADAAPTTAQVNPDAWANAFRKALQSEDDEIVCLPISRKLSGTYQSACIAAEMVDADRIHIVDTLSVTFALAMLVEEAVIMRDKGMCAAAIKDRLTELKDRICLFAAVDTLKYLKMGGRISATTAMVGGLMGILPIISVKNGKVESIGKVRGKKATLPFIENLMAEHPIAANSPVSFGHSDSPEALEMIQKAFAKQCKNRRIILGDIGCVVGTHAGPGAYGIAYFAKK